ncbi:MAG: TIGR03936 family radical SAM-associated protein [Gemmataceae bacterium]|nr:TIGR03936 family radical SAM-associated protein [Gemmataceae bacterium]MDW8266240.1 TIGR03936 family radical SAM-associated protein [Gemmataceae bacterium]
MVHEKVRIRFCKGDTLRLISHHDLMRCLERMLRRAQIPYRSTEGFNPKPRMTFALSLALGVVGREEVVELELADRLDPEEVRTRLAAQAPAGLQILSVERLPPRAQARVRGVTYRLPVPADRLADLSQRCAQFLAQSEYWVERLRPKPKRLNIRPWVVNLRVEADALEMDLAVSDAGTPRPEEVLEGLGLQDVLAAGAVLERTRLVLDDDGTPSLRPARDSAAGVGQAEVTKGNA